MKIINDSKPVLLDTSEGQKQSPPDSRLKFSQYPPLVSQTRDVLPPLWIPSQKQLNIPIINMLKSN